VLVITAVMMVPMLGFAALAVDLGNWYQVKRQAQAAADAGALAGVQDLPYNAGTALTDASTYAAKNISGATTTPTTPYNGDSSKIAVTVSKNVPSIFGGILGITSETVTATAVAKKTNTGNPGAIFAYNTACGGTNGIYVTGLNNVVGNDTHSNGQILIMANNNQFGTTTYGGPNNCSLSDAGQHTTYGGGAATRDTSTEPWPADYIANPPTCTHSFTTNLTFTGAIASGIYCTTGTISFSGNNITGTNVTFVAKAFTGVDSNNVTLTGNQIPGTSGSLLFYQTGPGTLMIAGNNFSGSSIFAPNATINITGNNGIYSGFVEGLNVQISANNNIFTGIGPSVLNAASGSLVQ